MLRYSYLDSIIKRAKGKANSKYNNEGECYISFAFDSIDSLQYSIACVEKYVNELKKQWTLKCTATFFLSKLEISPHSVIFWGGNTISNEEKFYSFF